MKIALPTTMMLLLLLAISSCGEDSDTKDPTANFTFGTELSIHEPTQFTFSGEDAETYLWDFGDGSTGAVQNPSHLYTSAGDYTVNLTASNADGSDNSSKDIIVRAIPEGEYQALTITLKESILNNSYILFGNFNAGGVGQGTNISTGQPVTIVITTKFTVEDFKLKFDIESINSPTGSLMPLSFTIDTKSMSVVRSGTIYILSNDDFSFQIIQI